MTEKEISVDEVRSIVTAKPLSEGGIPNHFLDESFLPSLETFSDWLANSGIRIAFLKQEVDFSERMADLVEEWHCSPQSDEEKDVSLREHLHLTESEYEKWLKGALSDEAVYALYLTRNKKGA